MGLDLQLLKDFWKKVHLLQLGVEVKTLKKFGKINILVNNHGINPSFGHILDVSGEAWDKLFEVNIKAGFRMTKLVAPHIAKEGGGAIIFNGSCSGYRSPPGVVAYAVTKTTMIGLT
ncbi:unnamed protein product [Caenorhabditis brenneri]